MKSIFVQKKDVKFIFPTNYHYKNNDIKKMRQL